GDPGEHDRLPCLADQGVEREPHGRRGEPAEHRPASAEVIGHGPGPHSAAEPAEGAGRACKPREPEQDTAHLGEVDDDERVDRAVPERVDREPRLKDVDRARQPRNHTCDVTTVALIMQAMPRDRWVLLAYRLPREPSTPRIAVWRRLRRLGALQL